MRQRVAFLKYIFMRSSLHNFFRIAYCSYLFVCCNGEKEKHASPLVKKESYVKYAKRFSIQVNSDFTSVYVFGNKFNNDTTSIFVIYSDSSNINKLPQKGVRIKSPCKKIASLSSIYTTMLCDLKAINNIAAIDNIDYVNDVRVISKFNAGQLKELSKGAELNVEQTIALRPDIIFTFGMGNSQQDINAKLNLANIPLVFSLDHLEETPLARAEWIKLYAAFVNKRALADSIFSAVEKNYLELKSLAKTAQKHPSVFNELKYGDVWYVPGGKSYAAQLIKDAGAAYVWQSDSSYGSIPLSFELVYARAKDADYWINLSSVNTKQELLSLEPRYAEFKAVHSGHLYNNNKFKNDKGYSTYWETAMVYPNHILNDLICIFHPELKLLLKKDLYYYHQIN
jgi:iron complex transport system substrate-binding protein